MWWEAGKRCRFQRAVPMLIDPPLGTPAERSPAREQRCTVRLCRSGSAAAPAANAAPTAPQRPRGSGQRRSDQSHPPPIAAGARHAEPIAERSAQARAGGASGPWLAAAGGDDRLQRGAAQRAGGLGVHLPGLVHG